MYFSPYSTHFLVVLLFFYNISIHQRNIFLSTQFCHSRLLVFRRLFKERTTLSFFLLPTNLPRQCSINKYEDSFDNLHDTHSTILVHFSWICCTKTGLTKWCKSSPVCTTVYIYDNYIKTLKASLMFLHLTFYTLNSGFKVLLHHNFPYWITVLNLVTNRTNISGIPFSLNSMVYIPF